MQEAVVTPHIDRVLRGYQRRAEGGRKVGDREREGGGEANTSSPVGGGGGGGYESRLMQLERQLSQLLQKTKVSSGVFVLEPRHVLYTYSQPGRKGLPPPDDIHTLLVSIT